MSSGYYLPLAWPTDIFSGPPPILAQAQPLDLAYLGLANVFKPDFLCLLRRVGLRPEAVVVFHYKPYAEGNRTIHTDVADGSFSYAVNWILAESSLMSWFDLKPGVETKPITVHKTARYRVFDEHEVSLACETTCLGPMLVDTSVPHRGANKGSTDRWAFSLRFSNKFDCWQSLISAFPQTLPV